jgi:hypothetical protein
MKTIKSIVEVILIFVGVGLCVSILSFLIFAGPIAAFYPQTCHYGIMKLAAKDQCKLAALEALWQEK